MQGRLGKKKWSIEKRREKKIMGEETQKGAWGNTRRETVKEAVKENKGETEKKGKGKKNEKNKKWKN